jgi:hypothetical protein
MVNIVVFCPIHFLLPRLNYYGRRRRRRRVTLQIHIVSQLFSAS